MWQCKIIKLLFGFLFFHYAILAQQTTPINYGGSSGTKFHGHFLISYYLSSGDRLYKLADTTSIIDLGLYKDKVALVAKIEKLTLGLKRDFSKVKHSTHTKVFFVELVNTTNGHEVPDTLKLSGKDGHYGQRVIHSVVPLSASADEAKLNFTMTVQIVDGVYNRSWKGPSLTRSFLVLPKISSQETTRHSEEDTENGYTTSGRTRRNTKNRGHGYYSKVSGNEIGETPKSLERELWDKIQKARVADDKQQLLKHARFYQMNCELEIFENCPHSEDVLFLLLNQYEGAERAKLTAQYKSQYPNGKYKLYVQPKLEIKRDSLPPITKDLARIDHDDQVVLVNRVKGGEMPYFLKFYDTGKNKHVPVKSLRFNKQDILVDLTSLGVPEGNYKISVTDSQNRLFVEKEEVRVDKTVPIPKSVELGFLLGGFGILGFLYRKYIHF